MNRSLKSSCDGADQKQKKSQRTWISVFLYRFGYDYASTHVHPMANDGEADFEVLISPPGAAKLPDETVVRNSILVPEHANPGSV